MASCMVKTNGLLNVVCLLSITLFICCVDCSRMQAQEYDFDQIKKNYADENAVYLKRAEDATLKIEDGKLKVYSDVSEDMLMLSDKANIYGEKSIYYSYFNIISNIEAYTLVPQKKKFKTVQVRNILDKNDIGEGNFYDDSKAKSFAFSGIQPGARTVLSYREEIKEPHFFGHFFFSSYVPCVESRFSVTFPKDVSLTYTLFGADQSGIKFTKKEGRSTTTYTWVASNTKKFQEEDDSPNIRYYEPHIIVRINNYTVDGQKTQVLETPADLNRWYHSMVANVNQTINANLQHIVDSLVGGQATELEKVKKIFYWVQDNIKYVAFENGMGGFVPREASNICDKRYGDCKDMASIIVSMLGAAKIKAYLCWIGTRDIPYTYAEVPMPLSCNHMIATYIADGTYYFLDGTGKYAPLGLHTSMIQGKEAMLSKGENAFEVVKVPEIPDSVNKLTDRVVITLQNGQLQGSGMVDAAGYWKIGLSHNMQNMTEEEKTKYLKRYLLKGNNKFQVDSITYSNLDQREQDLLLHYKFSIADYVTVNADETYVNLNLDKTFQNEMIDQQKHKTNRMLNYKYIQQYSTTLEIPAGSKATYVPENTRFTDPRFGFDIRYVTEKNRIILTKTITFNTLMLTPADFDAWNRMIKKLSMAYNESIILKKNN